MKTLSVIRGVMVTMGLVAVFMVGCSSDSSATKPAKNGESLNDSNLLGIDTVYAQKDLPECTLKNANESNYVKKENAVYQCIGKLWRYLGNVSANADVLPNCSEKYEEELAYVIEDGQSLICHNGKWKNFDIYSAIEQENLESSSSAKVEEDDENTQTLSSSNGKGKSSSSSSYVEEPKEIIVVGGDFSSEISGDDVLFKGLWGLGLAEDSTLTDSSFNIVFTGIDYKVAWGFDVGNLTLTPVTINSNPIIFPTETPIDLNSWESAGVSVSLLDSGFTECGSYSFIVTVTASDGVHKYQRTEIIPFERDESYCVPCVDAALAQCPETLESNTICDNRDGKIYKTVTMGSQTWMAENLNYYSCGISRYSWCYENDEINCVHYGRLYTWTAAMGIDSKFQEEYADLFGSQRGICPEGFHIPSDAEVDALIDNLEDDANSIAEFGFTFSGKKFFAGFADLDREAYFWIADEDHSEFGSKRNARILTYTETFGFGGGSMMKDGGYSIRCIKD